MDRPMSDGGDTLHEVIGAPGVGGWMAPRTSGGVLNLAEERMVRRLDREPTIEELRAEGASRPWHSYVHEVSLERVEEVVIAWLEFIARMTPDEYAETNIEAQIEATMPGLSMGEILRCVRVSLSWSERDVERRADAAPGIVQCLERGEIGYRACPMRRIAAALSSVADLEPGRLQAQISAAWGHVCPRTERPVIVDAQQVEQRKRRAPLTQNLGALLRNSGHNR